MDPDKRSLSLKQMIEVALSGGQTLEDIAKQVARILSLKGIPAKAITAAKLQEMRDADTPEKRAAWWRSLRKGGAYPSCLVISLALFISFLVAKTGAFTAFVAFSFAWGFTHFVQGVMR